MKIGKLSKKIYKKCKSCRLETNPRIYCMWESKDREIKSKHREENIYVWGKRVVRRKCKILQVFKTSGEQKWQEKNKYFEQKRYASVKVRKAKKT